jgi:2-oxoglutarate dehydrogenase E1 component
LEAFTKGSFQEVIGDEYADKAKVKRVLICSGKVFFDLLDRQEKDKRKDVAIIRLEQLHPFPTKQVEAELAKYKSAEIFYVQEEPENMGYWSYVIREFGWSRFAKLVARKKSASPATGFLKVHGEEQAALINRAFE